MPKKRFTNEQIAFALRKTENGALVGEICRKMGAAIYVKRGRSDPTEGLSARPIRVLGAEPT